jgi:hypothetical protein
MALAALLAQAEFAPFSAALLSDNLLGSGFVTLRAARTLTEELLMAHAGMSRAVAGLFVFLVAEAATAAAAAAPPPPKHER